MAYWLFKSKPYKYSWDELVKDGSTHWDGVRNFEAAKNMKSMKVGDRGFYYHSNKGKEIVGICEVVKEYYPDHTDESGRFGMVDVKVSRNMVIYFIVVYRILEGCVEFNQISRTY